MGMICTNLRVVALSEKDRKRVKQESELITKKRTDSAMVQ
jgi:hypothetical protein